MANPLSWHREWHWHSTTGQPGRTWLSEGTEPGSCSLRVPLCSPFLPSLPPAPRTPGVFWNADTDPCQGQLAEINMPGLKGPRAAGGSGAVTHGLPARHSQPCWDTLCQGSPRLCPPWHHPPGQSRAAVPLSRALAPGDSWACGAAVALPAWCQVGVHTQQGSVFSVQCL